MTRPVLFRRLCAITAAAWMLALCGIPPASAGQTTQLVQPAAAVTNDDDAVLTAFRQKAYDYINRQNHLPAAKAKSSANPDQLAADRKTLQQAEQASRHNAKQGEFFTAETAIAFRKLLAKTMTGRDGAHIRASLRHAEPNAPSEFEVNMPYPNRGGQPLQSAPPSLLRNLPMLPAGLEYRVAGSMLALRDSNANLVVDYLPNAFQSKR